MGQDKLTKILDEYYRSTDPRVVFRKHSNIPLESILRIVDEVGKGRGLSRNSFLSRTDRATGVIDANADDGYWINYSTRDNKKGDALGIYTGLVPVDDTDSKVNRKVTDVTQVLKQVVRFYLMNGDGKEIHEIIMEEGRVKNYMLNGKNVPLKETDTDKHFKHSNTAYGLIYGCVKAIIDDYLKHK